VGTGGFDQLVQAVDALPVEAHIQIGSGRTIPQRHAWFRFADDLRPYERWADVVVAHAGVGTIFEVLRLGKKLVCIANPGRIDRHQEQILDVLAASGHLIRCPDVRTLDAAIGMAIHTQLTPYVPPRCDIARVLQHWLAALSQGER
jgi:beta-1,4-N-acetylglucosaminyltransferase